MTREEDLIRIARKLDRMVSGDNTEGALAVLKELKDFDMTLKLLQETRVGMSVNSIRKRCSDAEVIALAKILIKDWKRLLEPARSQAEEPEDGNDLGSSHAGGSPSLSETHSSPKKDPRPEQNPPQKPRGDPQARSQDLHEPSGREVTGTPPLESGPHGDHPLGPGKTHGRTSPGVAAPPVSEKRGGDGGGKRRGPDPREGERRPQEPRRGRHRDEDEDSERRRRRRKRLEVEPEEKKKDPEKYRSHDSTREERRMESAGNGRHGGDAGPERWPHRPPGEPQRGRRLSEQRPLFERRGVMDSSVLYPTRYPSPPRIHLPARPPRPPRPPQTPLPPARRPPADAKPDRKRKRSIDPSPRPTRPPPPRPASPAKRPSLEVKKERRVPPDPNAPIAPLPFHLHPPPARREPPDPNAPFAPLPFHLHPPPLTKRPPTDRKKPAAEIKKDPSDAPHPSLKASPERLKRDRKDSSEGKEARKPSLEVRKERKDSTDLKPPPQKRPTLDVKKERNRRDSSDSKPGLPVHLPAMESKPDRKDVSDSVPSLPVKRLSTDSKPDRKDSCDSKAGLPVKRLSMDSKPERKDSCDSKAGLPVKRLSMDSKPERKDSCDSKAGLPVKRLSMDSKPERKGSCDSRVGLPVKRLSMDSKSDRKESSDSRAGLPVRRFSLDSRSERKEPSEFKKASPPLAKKLGGERRESQGAKPLNPVRKPSADGPDRRAKGNIPPLTPPSPSSSLSPAFSPGGGPLSPGFSPSGGPLSPRLATGDTVRDKCIAMLSAALRTDNDFMEFGANCEQMAVDIEDHIYQEIRATDMKYKNRVRSRISNLKDPKNPGLRRNVLSGYIQMTRIASMSAEEMASDELKQLRNVLTQEAIREHQMAKTGGTSTDLLQCGKCRKKNCTYNQVQTRSADEPMTTFVLCNECGNRWKFC